MRLLQEAICKIKHPDKNLGQRVREAFGRYGSSAEDWGRLADLTSRYAAASGCSQLTIPRKAIVLMLQTTVLRKEESALFPRK